MSFGAKPVAPVRTIGTIATDGVESLVDVANVQRIKPNAGRSGAGGIDFFWRIGLCTMALWEGSGDPDAGSRTTMACDSSAKSASETPPTANSRTENLGTATFSMGGSLIVFGGLLLLGGAALFAGMLYAAMGALRWAYVQEGRRFSRCRLTGREIVCRLLEHLSLPSDRIDDGAKIDHYDQLRRRVKLRTESSVSSSVAALAIAAHEVGHAEQFATGYWAARATHWLLILLALSGVVLFVYPLAAPLGGAGEANLTGLIALLAILALWRLPVSLALERDATRRAKRLLNETGLVHETEQEGIARLLQAAFRTHVALSVGLVLLIGAGVATMWLIEGALDMPSLTSVQVAVGDELEPRGPLTQTVTIDVGEPSVYPLMAIASLFTVWWAFSGRERKGPTRTAVDANNEGMARYHAGDLAGAMALIDEALRQDPGLAFAHHNRAVVLSFLGRGPEALASIESLLACRPEEVEPLAGLADLWYLRGTLRLDQGDYEGAIDDLSRALTLDPAEPAVLLSNRGLAWIKLGQLDRALQDTDEALALSPDDAVAYNNRGVIYRDQGHLEQAEADLRRAIAIDPQLANPREHLAKLLEVKAAAAV
jgi:Zn-dependent membrane protease YugP/Flp pilus assembly protein TadD